MASEPPTATTNKSLGILSDQRMRWSISNVGDWLQSAEKEMGSPPNHGKPRRMRVVNKAHRKSLDFVVIVLFLKEWVNL